MLKKSIRADAGRLITSGTDRAIRAIEGSGNMKDLYLRASMPDARKASARYGPNLGKSAATEDQEYNGPLYLGTGVNRLKKGQRWEQFANATVRDGIDTAGKAARVYYDSTNPMAQMGFGIGGNIKAVGKDSGKRLIISGTDRAIRAIDGSGIGGNIKTVGKDSGKRLIISGTDRAIRAIDGSGVNRLKKGQRWDQFANATIRDGIDTAGKAARVYYDSTDPMAQMGFGLKKRGRPRKSGGALYPAGVY
jgi:hypothetical protein